MVEWRERGGRLAPFMAGEDVVWAAQPGAQEAFLECPLPEVLLEGPRGGGKTDALLMDFAQHVGKVKKEGEKKGYGQDWRGILFRQTYKQLSDVILKTKKWFPRMFPSATFNSSDSRWNWPTGEILFLRYMERQDDYWNYHGQEFPWIGWEELTTWPSDECYRVMMSCWRSPYPNIPLKFRATTNPYGCGHNWVKARFCLPTLPGRMFGRTVRETGLPARAAIHSSLEGNQILLRAQPDYRENICAAARNPAELAAWLEGDWNIVAGGMFDDLWYPQFHVLPDIPLSKIPRRWKMDRSYDHGQSAPFSVGWWAESNGEPIRVGKRLIGALPGDLIRVAEWYGWSGKPNEGLRMLSTAIADGIVEREVDWEIAGRVRPGPADSSIFDDYEPGKSVAGDMRRHGVRWVAADKGRGSRVQGWQQMRERLSGSIPGREGVREYPGLFICRRCENFLRTIPVLPRCDKNLDDVDTESEDHVADEARYRVRKKRPTEVKSWSY
jgi:hypothetical protein